MRDPAETGKSVNPKADKPPWNAWNKVKHADYKAIT